MKLWTSGKLDFKHRDVAELGSAVQNVLLLQHFQILTLFTSFAIIAATQNITNKVGESLHRFKQLLFQGHAQSQWPGFYSHWYQWGVWVKSFYWYKFTFEWGLDSILSCKFCYRKGAIHGNVKTPYIQ